MPARHIHPARSLLLTERARLMRSAMTVSEAKLWSALSGSRLGVGFRRQVVIGSCIVDFASPEARLVIEVDGGYHETRERADARRDRRLRCAGYRVLRVRAEEVMRDLPAVVARIRAAL